MTQHIATRLPKVQDRVEQLLAAHPQARDSDKWLYLVYLRSFHRHTMSFADDFDGFAKAIMDKDVPTPETVSRARRKIQAEGKHIGTRRPERADEAKGVSDWATNN